MSLSLRVPFIGKEFLDFRILEWLVDEGDEVGPGTDLCVLRAVTRQRIERWEKPKRFGFRRKQADEPEEMKIRHHPPLIHVTAGESGIVQRFVVPVDGVVRQGADIASIVTGPESDDEGDGGQFHAVANMMGVDTEGAG